MKQRMKLFSSKTPCFHILLKESNKNAWKLRSTTEICLCSKIKSFWAKNIVISYLDSFCPPNVNTFYFDKKGCYCGAPPLSPFWHYQILLVATLLWFNYMVPLVILKVLLAFAKTTFFYNGVLIWGCQFYSAQRSG